MRVKLILTVLCCLGATPDLFGADIRVLYQDFGDKTAQTIVIEGPIEAGDYESFIDAVKGANGYVEEVLLYTPGGDFFEAMKIGRAMRGLRLHARAPLARECENGDGLRSLLEEGYLKDPTNCLCASAGFFILAGAAYRSGSAIYVHRPTVIPEILAGLGGTQASVLAGQLRTEAEAYLTEMGVPQSVIDFTWSVPGNDVAPLPREARETYFSGFVSEYQDWYNARCTSDTMGCLADTMKELQAEAYAGFFGAEPSSEARRVAREAFDVQVHPYALWIDARSFLGKTLAQFHGLTGDAFFQTMTIGGRTFTLHADQESDGQRFLSQDQRASVPRLLLVLRNGTIRDVVLDYHIGFLTQMCARFSPSRSAAPWEEGADALVPANQR